MQRLNKRHPTSFLYSLLLFALPADVRREFGEDMAQLFRDQRAATPGLLGRARLWLAALGDITAEAAAARAERWHGVRIPRRPSMRTFLFDFKHGFRLMRRYPSSTLLAILTLAIGIGATTAIFSVLDAVVLRQLPYEDPDRLVMLWEKREREGVLNNGWRKGSIRITQSSTLGIDGELAARLKKAGFSLGLSGKRAKVTEFVIEAAFTPEAAKALDEVVAATEPSSARRSLRRRKHS